MEAQLAGWRYFRVMAAGETPLPGSVECLADAKGKTCAECGICNGARLDRSVQPTSVWITVHGPFRKRFAQVAESAKGIRPAGLRVLS